MNECTTRATTWTQRLSAYYYLCRFDKPIGTELVIWPTLWALWVASDGSPAWGVVGLMALGAVLMRAAGCAINDFADRKIDAHVARTKTRPLATGIISAKEALAVFALLIVASASLLLFLPIATFYWALGAVLLATIYPFMKRYTHLPQVVLGAAFSWSIPMAYSAVGQTPDLSCWLLYVANLAWTVAYDTQYAMTDREDDLKIGVKSTAILFGRYDLGMIGLLQGISLLLLTAVMWREHLLNVFSSTMLLLIAADFSYQYYKTRNREPALTFWAFRHNRWIGPMVFVVVLLGLYF